MTHLNTCRLCGTLGIVDLLDVGKQPICNRYLSSANDDEYMHTMSVGQCNACGMIQLTDPIPAYELLPPYSWITYNEPEGHLDRVADTICELPDINKDSGICGISYKDDSLLERLRKRGFSRIWRIDPEHDLAITDSGAGTETIQDRLRPEIAKSIKARYGAADVVIARHILEHADSTRTFMQALHALMSPQGYVAFEVPDCTPALETSDYTTLWEEHFLYFTPETFQRAFAFGGFAIVDFASYPYSCAHSLVGIARVRKDITPTFPSTHSLRAEIRRATTFSEQLAGQRQEIDTALLRYRESQGKIAMFGAGHLASTFINVMQLKDHITFVVDDDPRKRGLYLPGSRLPIYDSAALIKDDIKLCLISIPAENEDQLIDKQQAFVDQNGTFASIFPISKYSVLTRGRKSSVSLS